MKKSNQSRTKPPKVDLSDDDFLEKSCEVCGTNKDEEKLLLCDGCNDQYHTFCLVPKLNNVPKGNWFCFQCDERLKKARASNYTTDNKNAANNETSLPLAKKLTGPRSSARVLSPIRVYMDDVATTNKGKKRGRSEETKLKREPARKKSNVAADIDLLDLKSCEVCGTKKKENKLLICDGCDDQYHTFCLVPELTTIPKGDWFCKNCLPVKRNSIKPGKKVASNKKMVEESSSDDDSATDPNHSPRKNHDTDPLILSPQVRNSNSNHKSPVDSRTKDDPREKAFQSVMLTSSDRNHTTKQAASAVVAMDSSREKALQSVLSTNSYSSNNIQQTNDSTVYINREKALQSALMLGSSRGQGDNSSATKDSSREKALQSVLFRSSNNTTQQSNAPVIIDSKEKALQSVFSTRNDNGNSALALGTHAKSKEKALQSVLLTASQSYNAAQHHNSSFIDISREKALQSVSIPSPNHRNSSFIDISREKALQSVNIPSPNHRNSSFIDISREKALQSVNIPSSLIDISREKALQSVNIPSSLIDISREKALQSVNIPSLSVIRPSSTPKNQGSEASRIVGMYRNNKAIATTNVMVQLEAVNSQNDPVFHPTVPKSSSSKTTTHLSSTAPVSSIAHTHNEPYAPADYHHGFDDEDTRPVSLELVTSQNDPLAVASALLSMGTGKNDKSSVTSNVRSTSTNNTPNTASNHVASRIKNSTPSASKISSILSTSGTSVSGRSVPSTANTSNIPSVSKINSIISTSGTSALSPTKNSIPSTANPSSIPSASKINSIPSTANTSSIPSASKINSIPSTANTSSIPNASKINSIPSTANTSSIPSASKINSIPSTANTSSIPSASKINSIPSTSGTSVSGPGIPSTANTSNIPSVSEKHESNTFSNSGSSPTKNSSAANATTNTGAPTATDTPSSSTFTNTLPGFFFTSPTKRVWQREDVCSIPYTNLGDLKAMIRTSSNDSVSVMGIVASFTRVKRCSGKNKYMASYSLVDTTCSSASDVVIVNIFGDKIENFPRVTAIGDVLRLNRVKLGEYKGAPQLLGSKQFNSAFTCFSRCNVYNGTSSPRTLPTGSRIYQSAVSGIQVEVKQRVVRRGGSEKQTEVCIPLSTEWNVSAADFFDENHDTREIDYSFNVGDMVKIKALYTFGMNLFIRDPIGDPNAIRSLGSLQQRNTTSTDVVKECDFTCMVVRTFIKEGHKYIEVWDGTTTDQISADSIKSISRVDTDIPPQDNSVSIYQAMNESLHTATVYVDATNEESVVALEPKVKEIPVTVSRRNVLKGFYSLFPLTTHSILVLILSF